MTAAAQPSSAGEEFGDGARAISGQAPKVSVVIPCLNEVGSLPACIERAKEAFSAAGIAFEVVVADNGSTDGSPEVAAAAGARVVHVAARGYGSAVRSGIEAAQGRLILLADADGQHDLSEGPAFVEKIEQGYDLVMGNRFGGQMLPGAMSWTHRYIGNPLLSGVLRLFFHPKIHDAQCGMRALTKEAYAQLDLRTTGFELCPEMVVKAARAKMAITEIPITVRPDLRGRTPHLRTVPDGWRHLSFILMCSPNYLFVLPGLVLFGFGVAVVSWLLIGPQHIAHIPLDTRAQLFGVLSASLGFDIASIGVFARVFSYAEPRKSSRRSLTRFLRSVRLEQCLALGGVLMAVGLAGALFEYIRWASHGFGILQHDRAIIFWSMWFLIGVQMCFASFFLSMIGVSRGTWIGDRP